MQSTTNNKLQKWQRQKKSKIKIFILYEISNKNISITMFYCEKYPKTSSVKFSIIMAAFIYKHNPDIFLLSTNSLGCGENFCVLETWLRRSRPVWEGPRSPQLKDAQTWGSRVSSVLDPNLGQQSQMFWKCFKPFFFLNTRMEIERKKNER